MVPSKLISQINRLKRAFSLTWPAAMQISRNKRKFLHKKRVLTPTGLDWDTNMAAVSLFWDTNMAAVTSCENTLFEPTVLVALVGTDIATLPFQCWFTRLARRIPENNIERGEGNMRRTFSTWL